MRIPYMDLSVRDPIFKDELLQAVDKVLSHGRIILGPEVGELEQRIAVRSQKKHAVGLNSGTDALFLAMKSLGVGPGDEVITTALSWIATANAIVLCGATPIFVDIGEDLNINADLIAEAVTPRTRVILPVHWGGLPCDMAKILEIAGQNGVSVIEDAAQAFGSHIDGAMAGSFGQVNCFSMNPMKIFNAYGDAGAVVTDDDVLHEKLVSLRYGGTVDKEDCHYPSVNARLDTIQAAMLLVGLQKLDEKIAHRRMIAEFYSQALEGSVTCLKQKEGYFSVFSEYTIIAEDRDRLMEHLTSQGIETKIRHPILMPYHTAYQHMAKPNIPVAERLISRILSIPNQEDVGIQEAEIVAGAIKEFYGR